MENESEKSPAGAASRQEETHLHTTTSTTARSTITAPEAEPAPGPTPTAPAATSEDSPSPVPPPPQPQPFPSPYTGQSTSWTGASVPPQETPNAAKPIPPPPKASEMHLYKASTTTTKPPSAHIDTQTHAQHHHIQTLPHQHQRSASSSSHSNALPNLEHPPGYRQNPAIAQPSPATLAADGAGFGTGEGPHFGMRQVWDPAPGEAGGRYVYQYDFFGDDEDRNDQAADDGEWLWNSAAGAWETTLSWMKSAGERMAEAEEGIWRWVNSRS